MSIINNMPNKAGMEINGIIQEYQVGENGAINVGDFVSMASSGTTGEFLGTSAPYLLITHTGSSGSVTYGYDHAEILPGKVFILSNVDGSTSSFSNSSATVVTVDGVNLSHTPFVSILSEYSGSDNKNSQGIFYLGDNKILVFAQREYAIMHYEGNALLLVTTGYWYDKDDATLNTQNYSYPRFTRVNDTDFLVFGLYRTGSTNTGDVVYYKAASLLRLDTASNVVNRVTTFTFETLTEFEGGRFDVALIDENKYIWATPRGTTSTAQTYINGGTIEIKGDAILSSFFGQLCTFNEVKNTSTQKGFHGSYIRLLSISKEVQVLVISDFSGIHVCAFTLNELGQLLLISNYYLSDAIGKCYELDAILTADKDVMISVGNAQQLYGVLGLFSSKYTLSFKVDTLNDITANWHPALLLLQNGTVFCSSDTIIEGNKRYIRVLNAYDNTVSADVYTEIVAEGIATYTEGADILGIAKTAGETGDTVLVWVPDTSE